MIDAHSEVIEIHQENYQDLISTHSIYGRCDPLFHRIALHLGVRFQYLNIRGNSYILYTTLCTLDTYANTLPHNLHNLFTYSQIDFILVGAFVQVRALLR